MFPTDGLNIFAELKLRKISVRIFLTKMPKKTRCTIIFFEISLKLKTDHHILYFFSYLINQKQNLKNKSAFARYEDVPFFFLDFNELQNCRRWLVLNVYLCMSNFAARCTHLYPISTEKILQLLL